MVSLGSLITGFLFAQGSCQVDMTPNPTQPDMQPTLDDKVNECAMCAMPRFHLICEEFRFELQPSLGGENQYWRTQICRDAPDVFPSGTVPSWQDRESQAHFAESCIKACAKEQHVTCDKLWMTDQHVLHREWWDNGAQSEPEC